MRLFEAVSDVVDSLELFFRNKIGEADKLGQPLTIPYNDPQLVSFMHSKGFGEISYDAIDSIINKPENAELKDMVSNYDSQGITLKTKVEAQNQQDAPMTPNSNAGKSVDQMAHNVVSKGL
jgi:hypothetical protein